MTRLAFFASLAFCLACDPPVMVGDAGTDAPMMDGGDPYMGQRLPRCEDTEAGGADVLPAVGSTLEARIVSVVPRFSAAGMLNPATEAGELMYRGMGIGRVMHGAPRPRVLRNDLGASTPPTATRHSIAWLAVLSDFQLVDDESPARLSAFDNPTIPSGLRAQEVYLSRAISAMNGTFARLHREGRPFDAGVLTGDCADSAQANELRWVIELMNGVPGTETDSGDDDDPIAGPGNDPKDPFDPVAFPAPWLFVPGNHDVEIVGITAPRPDNVGVAVGTRSSTGTRDYRRWYAPALRGEVPADPERRIIDRDEIVAMLRADSAAPGPVGHGYASMIDTSLGANYTYDVVPGLLRIVALDTSDQTGGSEGLVLRGTVDTFLVPALEQAARDGVLVMLASHHATSSIDVFPGQAGTTPLEGAVSPEELESTVASHEVVIAWLVGHSHDNRVRPRGRDATHRGYWEIMTAAIADWPGQSRTVEVVDNGNGTLSIFSTTIDFDADDCHERRFRTLLNMEWVSAWVDDVSENDANHNVELLIDIPSATMASVMTASATAPTDIESETTLRGM